MHDFVDECLLGVKMENHWGTFSSYFAFYYFRKWKTHTLTVKKLWNFGFVYQISLLTRMSSRSWNCLLSKEVRTLKRWEKIIEQNGEYIVQQSFCFSWEIRLSFALAVTFWPTQCLYRSLETFHSLNADYFAARRDRWNTVVRDLPSFFLSRFRPSFPLLSISSI